MYLNTKLCCFFCLKQIAKKKTTNSSSNSEENINGSLFKLQNLCNFLKIHLISASASESYRTSKNECSEANNLEVLLCRYCSNAYTYFTKLFLELERIEMEISYWTDSIQETILEASRTPEVVQEYSKRMTSDADTLSKLPVIDKLRKEIASKFGSVKKHRTKIQVVLTKINEELAPFHSQIAVKTESQDSVPILSSFEAVKNESISPPDVSPPHSPSSPPPSPPIISSKLGGSHKTILLGIHYIKTGDKFKCLSCNKVLESKMGTRFHIRTKHFGKRYKCPKCKDQFTLNINLKNHLKKCTGVKPLRGTPTGFVLGKHVTKNLKTKEYECNSCEKAYRSLNSAREHYIGKHIRGTIKCPKCNGEFKSSSHIYNCKPKVKKEPRPIVGNFKCDNCNAVIKTYLGFQFHVKRCKLNQLTRVARGTMSVFNPDSGVYNCSICKKEFSSRFVCRNHYLKVHMKKQYKCDICNVGVFTHEGSFYHHKRKCRQKHPEKASNMIKVELDKTLDADSVAIALEEIKHENGSRQALIDKKGI